MKLVMITSMNFVISLVTFAQINKLYTVSKETDFDTLQFSLKATATNCILGRNEASEPLVIYSDVEKNKVTPSFYSEIVKNTCFTSLNLDEYTSSSFGESFSMAISSNNEDNDFWKVSLSDDKVHKLNLCYAFGNADVNLTGIPIQDLKIKSGSADIIVGYDDGNLNPIQMDTFFVKADFGSIVAKSMELARAQNVITKIGFGNVLLDFEQGGQESCHVDASIGAGTLKIVLPNDHTPVIIKMKNSPLCSIKMVEGFEKVEKNVYVNMDYQASADNLLTFDIDVAMGMVSFEYAGYER